MLCAYGTFFLSKFADIKKGKIMRLDKYLKVSRIIKRRTVANDACDNALVTVNDKPAKASYDVKVGDVISITFGERTVKVRVLEINEHALKKDAALMYEAIE